MAEMTYWNGEPCQARRTTVRILPQDFFPAYWANDKIGETVPAVIVDYNGEKFCLYDEDGRAWAKVTEGQGSPGWGHRDIAEWEEVTR